MKLSWQGRKLAIGLPALSLALLLQAQDCPGGAATYRVPHYQLPECPSAGFALPDSALAQPFAIFALRRSKGFCAGFQGYALREDGKKRIELAARLNRGQTCSVDIMYSYAPGQARPTHVAELGAWATTVAQMVMATSGTSPNVPPSGIDTFVSYEQVRDWCARTVAASGTCHAEPLVVALRERN